MRKIAALILSFGVIYGITLVPPSDEKGFTRKKTLTYNGINRAAVKELSVELDALKSKINTEVKAKPSEIVTTQIEGKEKFLEQFNQTMNWLQANKVLYRFQVKRTFENVIAKIEIAHASEIEQINQKVKQLVNTHIDYSKSLKFSPAIISEFQARLKGLLNPLTVKQNRTVIPATTQVVNKANFESINNLMKNLTEERSVMYETHVKEQSSAMGFIGLFLAGLGIGILGFASLKKTTNAEMTDKSEMDALSGTIKRVLKELNYPVFICDSNFNVNWQNLESEKLNLDSSMVQEMLSDAQAMENYELDSKSYSIKVEELKYKSGKVNYVVQLVRQTISPRVLSNIVNSSDFERVLENSLESTKDFKSLNQLVAENTIKMNYLFKVSAKVIDVDFDENLSECFIEANRLNDAVREFIMANYNLIKDDSRIAGLFLRTSEKGQRFNLNCFIPSFQKDSFNSGEASKVFIQKLSGLESKFNLYHPRVSFRWVSNGETNGVDVCLSLENKSELESLLRESNS